jgi:hypothetical protein
LIPGSKQTPILEYHTHLCCISLYIVLECSPYLHVLEYITCTVFTSHNRRIRAQYVLLPFLMFPFLFPKYSYLI